jgi:uncharacterized protein YndB with AHSA1/START domain
VTVNETEVAAPPDRVFDAIADARTYPEWLVGAKRIRHVDDSWPEPGSRFHHTVGIGFMTVKDATTVMAIDRPHRLELEAGVGPLGAAHVRFTVESSEGGSRVTVEEEPSRGLMRALWHWAGKALMGVTLFNRNLVSLEHLCAYVEESGPADPDTAGGRGSDDLNSGAAG